MWKFVRFFLLKIVRVEVCDVDVCIIVVKVFTKQEIGTFLNILYTIKSLRKSRGLSQEVLSGLAGIVRTHLTMIENGTKQANFSTICKIASALKIRSSELVRKIEDFSEQEQG